MYGRAFDSTEPGFTSTDRRLPGEPEQKTVLFITKIDEKHPQIFTGKPQEESGDKTKLSTVPIYLPEEIETKEKSLRKFKLSDSEDVGMRVITLAGENKGAFMELTQTPQKQVGPHSHPFIKTIEGKLQSSSGSSEDGSVKNKDKKNKGKTVTSPQMRAFMNSNVQGVNNSIIFNGSCTHHDPGVHLSLSRKPFSEGVEIKEHGNAPHT
ncbi:vegetative cell wall protein gp1-like [Quillaja saponaria]|uniref:Vegetative cell wall protein gp1-like n=1 Tax=Quillaja saponaria TaxID=32244 RepID=A0AAD7L634_QUISA|nr:vegetative cell wall protein gp1-like [Quillaja saponaria]